MAVPKTYFVFTNFDLAPDGPFQLGSVIAGPLEPAEILNPGNVLQIPSDHVRTRHKRDWDLTESLEGDRVSVTKRFILSLKLNGTLVDTDVLRHFSIQDVETLDFAPTQSYVDETINQRSVRDYLEGCQCSLPVYMVTGLKIGRRLSNSLPLGSSAGDSRAQQTPQKYVFLGGTSDFVIGYRLVKIIAEESKDQVLGGTVKSGGEVMGKMLGDGGDDDGRDTDFGSLRITLTANIDGGREVEAHEIIGSNSFNAIEEDGSEECCCFVVS